MPLARLENFLKNINGNTLYVDPNEIDSTDSIENKGNSRTRPFKTIQRALLEAARFSYVAGQNNDLFDQTTILISPGTHYIDNRPGYYWDGSNFRDVNNSVVEITELSVASNMDLESPLNTLYIYNSAEGGVIIPKGVSIVASDLRKTKIRPKFVPDPANDNIARSAIFRLTGASYIFGFTIFDGNPVGGVYNTYTNTTVNPTYSHHKLTAFEYADGKNIVENSTLTDLDNYYLKVSYGYGNFSGRAIPNTLTDLQKNPEENKIVGDLGQGTLSISELISGDGSTATTTITVTTEDPHGLSPFTPIQISGVASSSSTAVQQQFNGNFVVSQIVSPSKFTYLLSAAPSAAAPSVDGATVKIQSDTVSSSSPYVFNCSLKSVYGMNGLHADGSKATGFKSLVTAQFTGISLQRDDRAFVKYNDTTGTYQTQNDLGTTVTLHQDSNAIYNPTWENFHIKASNDSFIQCVSIFAIGYAKQFVAESGGDQSITNSNSNFGAISLHSTGFKEYQLTKDNHAFITHIIPPKSISDVESNINCYVINAGLTTTVNDPTRIYLDGYTDQFTPPNQKVRGYTIGARNGDLISCPTYSGITTISPNYETSYNIDSISGDIITVEGTLSGISTGRAVRIIANNAVLPDGIESNKVYYVSPTSITSNSIKLRESLSSKTDVDIKNDIGISVEDNLKLIFRVSDCLPGTEGSPIQYDSTEKNWYLQIVSNSDFIDSLIGENNPTFSISRKIDLRSNDDKVYRARLVIPKESSRASDPSPGFIIQKSSSALDSIFSQPNNISLTSGDSEPIEIVRNDGIIVDAWTTTSGITTTVNIVTSRPHRLKVGNKVNIYDLKSSNEPSPVGLGTGTGFNGSFEVSDVVNNLQFRFVIDRNPGGISTTTSSSVESWMNVRDCSSSSYRIPPYTINSSNRDELPYFTCEESNTDFQIYKIKTIQKYSQNDSDGIYHIYLNSFKNTPTVAPFNIKQNRLSQNLDNLYPNSDVDNSVSDIESTISVASRKTIGKVEVNDPRLSTTKETIIEYLKDYGHGLEVSSISKTGSTCTVTTTLNHNINGIRQLTVTTAGSGFVNGTYYDIPLCTSTGSGSGATANVTVSGGVVTSATIAYSGSGYNQNDTVTVKGIPGSTNTVVLTVASIVTENLGCVQVLGSVYPQNNGIFKIGSITDNTISYFNDLGISEASSIAVVIPNIPAYEVSSVSEDLITNTTQVTTSTSNPFLVGNTVLFEGVTESYTVVEKTSTTVFKVSGSIPLVDLGGDVSGPPQTVYNSGLNSQVKDTNSTNENVGSRHVSIVDGFKGRIVNTDGLSSTETTFTARLANTTTNSALGLNKGDFLQIDDEIVLVEAISGTTVTCTRGVLGTKADSHLTNSAFRRIFVQPVELRRNSILRASGHTFEYTGFGPGNYSTGMPTNQDRVLSNDEILISQALPTQGGLVVYTGMNSNGEFFIGRKKYDATTGEEIDTVSPPNEDSIFFDSLTVNRLTVNTSIDASTAISKFGDLYVTGVSTISVSTPSDAFRITQRGSGNAFVVEDSTNPDETPFVIDNSGGVGIGTTNPGAKLNIVVNSSSDALRITQRGSGNALVVEDSANPDVTPFVVDNSGDTGIGTTNPKTKLHVIGVTSSTTFYGNGVIPVGGIIMWSGTIADLSTNPELSNWRLCNGSNGTPDLRSKFVVGATSDASSGVTFNANTGAVSGAYAPGNTGGETAHQLTTAEMPSHNHQLSRYSGNSNINTQSTRYALATTNNIGPDSTTSTGSDDYHENRPPYYALAFIMRVS